MDYFSSGNRFASLSLADLLTAREQFHAHLVHKRHVIGTAVGRYLIRKDDPYPDRKGGASESQRTGPKPPRTLEGSEIRDYSWPCVLVFVDAWVDESVFGKGELAASDYVPKTIYMPDGKAVPVCLVLAPRVMTPPATQPPPTLDPKRLQGGYPVVSITQNITHTATVGCLLTDGHKVFALTARHVAGSPGETLRAKNGPVVGTTSSLQLSRMPFESVYAPWPGKQAFVNLDVALVEVEDLTRWSSGIESIGPIGPLAALSTYNLSLSLIGCPVRAYGAASGPMAGRIAALFYRYKAVGGFDYMSDFLIGSRDDGPLMTLPGDSGALWVVDGEEPEDRGLPIAVQWGGTLLGGEVRPSTFALASNLSTICRELNVDVYRGPSVAVFEYWGFEGHKKIGQFATRVVRDPDLHDLMEANADNIGELANYPDTRWKGAKNRRSEGPNHYADIDLWRKGIKSLDEETPTPKSLSVAVWSKYYREINSHKEVQGEVSPGLLPFRVSQIFNELVTFVEAGDLDRIVAGMGILAHYIGDACQPLHSTYLTDGNPFQHRKGYKVKQMLPLGTGYGKRVHSGYERHMIDANRDDLETKVSKALPAEHTLDLVTTGRAAAWETLELMRRSMREIPPMELVEFYAKGPKDPNTMNAALWEEFGDRTVRTMIDGSVVLAMLWDSVWALGNGNAITEPLGARNADDLLTLCLEPPGKFLPSLTLEEIGPNEFD